MSEDCALYFDWLGYPKDKRPCLNAGRVKPQHHKATVTQDKIEKALELYRLGTMTDRAIEQAVGLTPSYMYKLKRKYLSKDEL